MLEPLARLKPTASLPESRLALFVGSIRHPDQADEKMQIEVLRADKNDYGKILALHHEAGWDPSRVDGEVWAAWHQQELVGSVQFEEVGPHLLFVRAMVVREDSRGRGIGARMFTEVMTTRNADWWLECREERIRFYARLGFNVVEQGDIPASVRQLVRPRADRQQHFMNRPRAA